MTNQSLLTRIPENTSNLQPTKFSFVIPSLPFLRYFVQTCSIPGVSTGPVRVDTPFSATWRHGDKLEFDELTVQSLVDEDLRVWEENFNWVQSLTFPEKFPQYVANQRDKKPYHDGFLTVNSNANIPHIRIKFTNLHPIKVSAIQFDEKQNANEISTIDIVFRYDLIEIERLPLTS